MALFKNNPRRKGQNITEYLILVAGVLVVVILATSKGGFFTKGVEKSINMMFDSVEDMATVQCLGTIDDVNGKWSDWSGWAGCAWDAGSSTCLEYSSRACNSPEQRCGGTYCRRDDATFTTNTDLTESRSQGCYLGSWDPGTCPAFSCAGACGSTVGTCARIPTCPPDNCCDPAAKPAATIACTKPAYPDVWTEFNNWTCIANCGEEIASQRVMCSGSCCDNAPFDPVSLPGGKPPTRAACTNGCCPESLYAWTDVGLDPGPADDTPVMKTFGPADNGVDSILGCDPGYVGNPTRRCTATADLICTDGGGCPGTPSSALTCKGDNGYSSAPAICYNIDWGPLSGECQPANCGPSGQVDIGYGGYTLMYEFGGANHDSTASVNCATLTGGTSPTTWGHTAYLGQLASYYCWLGAWQDLNAPCIPNCPAENNVPAGDVSVNFPETEDDTPATVTCSDYDEQPPGLGTVKYVGSLTRDCGILPLLADGQWGSVNGACTFKPCDGTAYWDNNTVLEGWFGNGTKASPGPPVAHETPITVTCSDVDLRYDGTFSRICTYGDWIPEEPYGGCAAKGCDLWTTDIPDSSGVSVTFAGIGHDQPQTGAWADNTYDCNAKARCCFGQWFPESTVCNTVTSAQINGVDDYSGTCAPYECQTTYVTPPVANASSCGDDTGLTADEDWSVVDDCTSAKTCEWACDSTFKKSGNACVDTVCTGGGFGGASRCGTQKPPDDMANWLNPSTCGSSIMCEYYCPNPSVYYDPPPAGDPYCCTPACPASSCGDQDDGCGGTIDCGSCCPNGAIDSGEQCDGTLLNGKTCAALGYTGTGTPGCKADCTDWTQGSCCNEVPGTWGAWGACSSCQQTRTCNGASCGGSCPADASDPDNDGVRDCYSGTWSTGSWGACSVSCGGGTQTRTVTCPSSCCDPDPYDSVNNPDGKPAAGRDCNTQACTTWILSSTTWSNDGSSTCTSTTCPQSDPTGLACSLSGSTCTTRYYPPCSSRCFVNCRTQVYTCQ